jgi:hypothetical protein
MKKLLVVVLGLAFPLSGVASAAEPSTGSKASVSGYLGPNFRMIDKSGSDAAENASDMGFGMAFNRVNVSGEMEAGKIVKNIGWAVEVDVAEPSAFKLQWAYLQPKFSDIFSLKFGHVKTAFSREWLHPTGKLLTVDRTPASAALKSLGYADYNYGLEAHVAKQMFKVQAGAYSGSPSVNKVDNQDPGINFGARAIVMPISGLEIGANAMMIKLYEDGNNQAVYPDDVQSNSGMAFGFDADFKKDFGSMELWAQAEFGMGDNWDEGGKEPAAGDTWEDYSWYMFQYYYLKALFMVTKDFGIHFGYSAWDPNTDSAVGENNSITTITPGITYFWAKNLRTQVEVQMLSQQQGIAETGANRDDLSYTHFVLQTVLLW